MAEFINVNVRNEKVYEERRTEAKKNFANLFRFSEINVRRIARLIFGEEKTETRGGALTNETKVKVFLRVVGDPGFQVGVGEDLGIHQTTVSKTVYEVMDGIVSIASDFIKFPQSLEEMNREKLRWQDKYSFPAAIGAIDCTHIPIRKPSIHGDEYVNRKGFCSLNVQATCNADDMFTSVDVSWPGAVHDSRIWKNSGSYRIMKANIANALLLGDAGYGIAPFLMTPYRAPSTPSQRNFNKILSKERVIIERCFGQLKQRFPILQNKVRLAHQKVPALIICCCVLHNVSKILKDDSIAFMEIEEQYQEENGEDEQENDRVLGARRREEIAQILSQRQ